MNLQLSNHLILSRDKLIRILYSFTSSISFHFNDLNNWMSHCKNESYSYFIQALFFRRDTLAQLTCDNLQFTDQSKEYFEANCTSPTIIDDIKDLFKADTTSKLIIPGLECQCGMLTERIN